MEQLILNKLSLWFSQNQANNNFVYQSIINIRRGLVSKSQSNQKEDYVGVWFPNPI